MVGLAINKQTFWYALFDHDEPVYDNWGNESGTKPVYGNPVKYRANISASRGTADIDLFGINAVYTKTINPLPLDFPLDEASVLWIDKEPTIAEDGSTTTAHDYVVTQVAKSLNHKAYAILKVNVADKPVEQDAEGTDDAEDHQGTAVSGGHQPGDQAG